MCIFTENSDSIFFLGVMPLLNLEIWPTLKILLKTVRQRNSTDCPSLMLGIAIRCMQHSKTMLERGVCELAHSFFHLSHSPRPSETLPNRSLDPLHCVICLKDNPSCLTLQGSTSWSTLGHLSRSWAASPRSTFQTFPYRKNLRTSAC